MAEKHKIKIMDFIDDVVLQYITYGTNETYSSYKDFMAKKMQELKDNPEKTSDITNIIPALKLQTNQTQLHNLKPIYDDMKNTCKIKDLIIAEKQESEMVKQLNDLYMKALFGNISKKTKKNCVCGKCPLDNKNTESPKPLGSLDYSSLLSSMMSTLIGTDTKEIKTLLEKLKTLESGKFESEQLQSDDQEDEVDKINISI
jgi:hypothetical protein